MSERQEWEQMVRDLLEAVEWMSGADDFGPEGQAHAGWVRLQPMLDGIRASLAVAGRGETR